jgi:hypothetical protein
MKAEYQIINPVANPSWNDSLPADPHRSIFHSSNWASVLAQSYDYRPLYFVRTDKGRITALIPFMEINSALTGRRGVSLPFTDCCDPLLTDGTSFAEIIADLIDYGKGARWKYLELRTSRPLPAGVPASALFHGHTLDISGSEKAIFAGLRDSTGRNIRKAEKEGVAVTISGTADALREFHRLNCMTRRDHGLPCQPYAFFEKIHAHIIARDLGAVALASKDGENIAGALFLHYGDKAIYKYGASDRKHLQLRSNNLLFWKAIQWYRGRGFKCLDFGRTEPENTGLLQFKRGWGAAEYPINYCKYDFRQKIFVEDHSKVTGWHNHIFRRMPLPLLKFAGSVLYRHVG